MTVGFTEADGIICVVPVRQRFEADGIEARSRAFGNYFGLRRDFTPNRAGKRIGLTSKKCREPYEL